MLKIAVALGIAYEWLCGPSVSNLHGLAYAAFRTLCAVLLAWMALEGFRVLYAAAMSCDPRPGGSRDNSAR